MASALRRLVVGKPIATSAEMTQRLTKLLALAVSSSDADALFALATRLRGRERTVVATYSFRPDA